MEAVRGLGRPGHLAEGDHIWSRRRVRCLRVTKTLVGRIANRPKGSPIVRADTTADSEIAGVADHRLGSEGASLLQILLDATGLVAAADLGVDALSKDFGREGPPLSGLPFALEKEHDMLRPTDVKVVADQSLEEGAPRLWAVEHARVCNLKLPHRQVVRVTGTQVGCREGRRETIKPAPEEVLHRSRPKACADPMQGCWVGARTKAVVQRLVGNSGLLELALGPLVTVEGDPDRPRTVGVGLPKRAAPIGIPEVEVEVVHERRLAAPLHVRLSRVLLALRPPRFPAERLLLSDAEQNHSTIAALLGRRLD